jgi:hypothetical protein
MGDSVGGGDELHGGDNGSGGGHVDMKPSAEYLMGLGYGGGGLVRKEGVGVSASASSSSTAITAYPPPAESPANTGTSHTKIFAAFLSLYPALLVVPKILFFYLDTAFLVFLTALSYV